MRVYYEDKEQVLFVYVRCDCGVSKWVRSNDLRAVNKNGEWRVTSCGCYKREQSRLRFTKHGMCSGREAARRIKREKRDKERGKVE